MLILYYFFITLRVTFTWTPCAATRTTETSREPIRRSRSLPIHTYNNKQYYAVGAGDLSVNIKILLFARCTVLHNAKSKRISLAENAHALYYTQYYYYYLIVQTCNSIISPPSCRRSSLLCSRGRVQRLL